MRIGLDIDGVVASWQNGVKQALHRKFGITLPEGESPYWNWIEDQLTPAQWAWCWNGAIDEGLFFYDVKPLSGAQWFVKELNKLGDVVVMTSRPRGAIKQTLKWWLEHDFPAVAGINFFDKPVDKYLVKTDVLIEDNLKNAVAYKEATGSPVILLDYPYNQGEWSPRVTSHKAAVEKVRDIFNGRF